MSSHDCSLRGNLAIKPEIPRKAVVKALRAFAEDTGCEFSADCFDFQDGMLDLNIQFDGYGGDEGDDSVRALAQTLCQMVAGRGALVVRDYDTGDYEASRTIVGIGPNDNERRLGELDFSLEELCDSLSGRLSRSVFEAQFAEPLRAAVSATFMNGEDSGREDGLRSPEGT